MSPEYEEKGRFVAVLTGTVVNVPAGDKLNLRYAPDAGATVVGTLDNGDEVAAQGEEVNAGVKWLLVNAGSRSGWVRADFINLTAAPCAPEPKGEK